MPQPDGVETLPRGTPTPIHREWMAWRRILSLRMVLMGAVSVLIVVGLFKLALSDGGRDPQTLTLAQTGLFVATALYLWLGMMRRVAVAAPLLAVTAAVAVTTVGSVRPDSSVRELLLWITYACAFVLVASTLSTKAAARRFLDALVVIAGWVALVGFYLFWGANNPGMRWYSTFYWPNPFAAFLLLFIPLQVARLVHARSVREALAHGAMAVLLLIPFVLTYSRGAWLSLVPVLLAAGFILRPLSWRSAAVRLLVVAGLTVGFVVLLTRGDAVKSSPRAVLGRAVSVANANDYSILGRLNFWRVGLNIMRDHLLAGTGPGTYAYSSAAYQRDIRYFARDAHNLYIQMAAEMGVIGIAVIGWLLVALASLARRTLRTARGTPEYPLVAGVVLGLGAFFLHSALDMNWQFPVNGAMAFALAGVLARFDAGWAPQGRPSLEVRRRQAWRVPAVVGLLAMTGIVQVLYVSDRNSRDGAKLAFSRQWAAAESRFRLASRLNPLNPNSPSALAETLQRIAPHRREETAMLIRRSMSLDRMNAYYPLQLARFLSKETLLDGSVRTKVAALIEHALVLDPLHYPEAYMMLARLHYEAGDPRMAEEFYKRARAKYPAGFTQDGILRMMLWPGVATLYMDWARFLRNEGRLGDARVVYQDILAEDPRYVPAYLEGADLLVRQHRVKDAVNLLRRGLDNVPASEMLWRRWRELSVGRSAIWEQ